MIKTRALPSSSTSPESSQGGCELMDAFGIMVQLCLAATAFSTLIVKRQREKPQRPLRIWGFDVSKQLAGGIIVHFLNVVAAVFFGINPEDGVESNPCVWYFLNILVDTTLGVGILWLILTGFKYAIAKLKWTGFQSGVYGDPPLTEQIQKWAKQLSVYIVSLMLMKVIVVALFHLCPWLSDVGDWVLSWTVDNYRLQVVFVMFIFPLVMNIMQFWIIDTIVKHKTDKENTPATTIRLDADEEDAQTLLRSHEESEEDEEERGRPPRYSLDDDDTTFVNVTEASSSSPSYRNEYELESKKH
ncbi:vacuolar membrane protein-domain-containing protein [Sporodiniella umbellata]|nr:vacuolar membrane protein-domain-containing protein [Sporodiniella umbellata]